MNSYPQKRLCRNEGKTNQEDISMKQDESQKPLGAQSLNNTALRRRW